MKYTALFFILSILLIGCSQSKKSKHSRKGLADTSMISATWLNDLSISGTRFGPVLRIIKDTLEPPEGDNEADPVIRRDTFYQVPIIDSARGKDGKALKDSAGHYIINPLRFVPYPNKRLIAPNGIVYP